MATTIDGSEILAFLATWDASQTTVVNSGIHMDGYSFNYKPKGDQSSEILTGAHRSPIQNLGGGFIWGFMIQFDLPIFFNRVEKNHQLEMAWSGLCLRIQSIGMMCVSWGGA